MSRKYYIAYGSNLDEAQMATRCPKAHIVGTSVLKDYRLMFKGSKSGAYATIEFCKGCEVPVLIWNIGHEDEKRLDFYEGFPDFYSKKSFSVNIKGLPLNAMAYIMDENRKYGVPTDRYYKVIENSYHLLGFDSSILEQAYKMSRENSSPDGGCYV